MVRHHLRCVHHTVLERQHAQRVFDDQPDEPLRVENKLVAWCSLVPDERVKAFDLRCGRQEVQRVGHRLSDVRVSEALAQFEAALFGVS